jgi:hypothetical protein
LRMTLLMTSTVFTGELLTRSLPADSTTESSSATVRHWSVLPKERT